RRRRQPSAARAVDPSRSEQPHLRTAGPRREAGADLAAGARRRPSSGLRMNGRTFPPPLFRNTLHVSCAPWRTPRGATPMPHKTLPTRLLTAMMATGLMLATTAALAQETRAEQRRAERAAKAQEGEQVDRFAGATRKEPETKTSSRASSTRLGKLSDAYEAKVLAQTQPVADVHIPDAMSSAFNPA